MVIRVFNDIHGNYIYQIGSWYRCEEGYDKFHEIYMTYDFEKAIRLVNYLNGGDGTINSIIEDICGE